MLDWWHFSVLKFSLALPDIFSEPLMCFSLVEEASQNTVMEAFLWWRHWIPHPAILASPGDTLESIVCTFSLELTFSWLLKWRIKFDRHRNIGIFYCETLAVISILFKQVSLTSFWKQREILSHAAKEAWSPGFSTSYFNTQWEVSSLVPEGWEFRLLSQEVLPGWVG